MKKVSVRFLRSWKLYSSGEVAGFDPDTSRGLIKEGYAEEYLADVPQPEPSVPAEAHDHSKVPEVLLEKPEPEPEPEPEPAPPPAPRKKRRRRKKPEKVEE